MLYNRERALELMREHDVAAMIGTTLENVTYLTGHIGWAQRVYRARKSYGVITNDPGRRNRPHHEPRGQHLLRRLRRTRGERLRLGRTGEPHRAGRLRAA